ncbi:centromere protein V-like protein 1 [Equus asinus]|uniref:centromere protein V-like protein 1 n=1 Tax=Equus asinus TaxID=9793 RepID=UPI0038F7B2F3
MDLGAQRERWETFRKPRSLSCEGSATFLLDTLEHPGPVRYTGGCHCGAVQFEPGPLHTCEFRIAAAGCAGSSSTDTSSSWPRASRSSWAPRASSRIHPARTRPALHSFCGRGGVQSFHAAASDPGVYAVAPHCLGQGTFSLEVKPTNTWRPPYARTSPRSAVSNLANLPFRCSVFMVREASVPGKQILVVTRCICLSGGGLPCNLSSPTNEFKNKETNPR